MPVRNGKFNPVLIKSALVPLIRELGLEADIHFDVINNNWENIVGKVNSMNTKPFSLKQGVLSISVSSPVWMTQSRFLKSSLIDKINGFTAAEGIRITDISFSLDRS